MNKKEADLPVEFVAKCKAITAQRAKTVITHVLKHGFITSQELKDSYGYNHPPRAIRDVKENGIPMDMFRVEGKDHRSIAAYRFGDPATARTGQFSGRTVLGKTLREALVLRDEAKCSIYREPFAPDKLQIDHRVPFEVSGDDPTEDTNHDNYMLVCASANRAKSWACEHCKNWLELKDPGICTRCYWAYPDDYEHVAMEQIRRLDVMWIGESTADYDVLITKAKTAGKSIPDFVKAVLKRIPSAADEKP